MNPGLWFFREGPRLFHGSRITESFLNMIYKLHVVSAHGCVETEVVYLLQQ